MKVLSVHYAWQCLYFQTVDTWQAKNEPLYKHAVFMMKTTYEFLVMSIMHNSLIWECLVVDISDFHHHQQWNNTKMI